VGKHIKVSPKLNVDKAKIQILARLLYDCWLDVYVEADPKDTAVGWSALKPLSQQFFIQIANYMLQKGIIVIDKEVEEELKKREELRAKETAEQQERVSNRRKVAKDRRAASKNKETTKSLI
jgi:hypothetical protein